jgi:hypothetical protein
VASDEKEKGEAINLVLRNLKVMNFEFLLGHEIVLVAHKNEIFA